MRPQFVFAKRLEREAPGVRESLLEGLDEILTVNRLRPPPEQRRSLRLHQRYREYAGHDPPCDPQCETLARCLDGTSLGCSRHDGAKAGFRRLKAHRQLAALRRALAEHQATHTAQLKVPAKLAETTKSIPTSAHHPYAANPRLPALGQSGVLWSYKIFHAIGDESCRKLHHLTE